MDTGPQREGLAFCSRTSERSTTVLRCLPPPARLASVAGTTPATATRSPLRFRRHNPGRTALAACAKVTRYLLSQIDVPALTTCRPVPVDRLRTE